MWLTINSDLISPKVDGAENIDYFAILNNGEFSQLYNFLELFQEPCKRVPLVINCVNFSIYVPETNPISSLKMSQSLWSVFWVISFSYESWNVFISLFLRKVESFLNLNKGSRKFRWKVYFYLIYFSSII